MLDCGGVVPRCSCFLLTTAHRIMYLYLRNNEEQQRVNTGKDTVYEQEEQSSDIEQGQSGVVRDLLSSRCKDSKR